MKFTDLTGDAVYDFIVAGTPQEIKGGYIRDNYPYAPKQPRKEIFVLLADGQVGSYNYLKLKRGIRDLEKYG